MVIIGSQVYITKTRLYNFDPLNPHFYIVKLGFTRVYIIFLISAKNIDCGYSLEPSTHNLCFEQKYEKYLSFLSENFQFLELKFSIYLNRRVFVMKKNGINGYWIDLLDFPPYSTGEILLTCRKTNSKQTVQIQIFRSQLIWIYTVCKRDQLLAFLHTNPLLNKSQREHDIYKTLYDCHDIASTLLRHYIIVKRLHSLYCDVVKASWRCIDFNVTLFQCQVLAI